MDPKHWPTVTVVAVNYNGRDYLEGCLGSILQQDYPRDRIEVLLIDNASSDGSVEFVRQRFPPVQVITNDRNRGFAPAVNQGARAGRGSILALINNDAVAHPAWLRELVKPLIMHDQVAATGGLVLDARGESVDFAGGVLAFYGHGFADHWEEPVPDDLQLGPTIFVTGASMAAHRELFLQVGGFDEDYFAYFEDVDLGWRLWVMGHEVWFVPTSVLYHRHHGTAARFGDARRRYLLERNALATIFKNYGDDTLSRTLPASVILTMLRGFFDEGSDLGDYRITSEDVAEPRPTVSAMTGAHLAAIRDFGLSLDRLREARVRVQAARRRDDREIMRLFRKPVLPNVPDATFLTVFQAAVDTFDLMWHATTRQRVLIITADTLGPKMAGPAIRAWEMAKLLAREHEVVLGGMSRPQLSHGSFKTVHFDAGNARRWIGWAEVIVLQGFAMFHFPEIVDSDAAVVVDIYDPFHIEAIVLRRDEPPQERWATARSDREVVNDQLQRGDLFLCASDKQRDFWLGQLAALGRINPATYDQDPDLRALLEVAPFGLPSEPPRQERHPIKGGAVQGGVADGIGADDFVLLWGGGIYNWFDPATLIRAVAKASADEPRLKLFFMGTAHPNPDVPEMVRAGEALRVAQELGVLGTHVFFNDDWVDYEDRANWLLDADVGVSTHFLHLETELSYRTRILDYLWAGLPIVCTEGDSLSRLVQRHDLGEVVKAEDVDDLAAALLRIATPERHAEARAHVEALAPTMTWERALRPLVDFCRFPRRAADVERPDSPYVKVGRVSRPRRSPLQLARRFVQVTQDKGLANAVRMAQNSLRMRREVSATRRGARGR
ncbi:MAG TPA: glycosyltransferase [Nitriliruptorales bacterium]|nr:glycosyltransferase [Nitriliruptorales bacterium]